MRAHGVRGEVSVEVRTDDPDRRFAPGSVLRTEPDRGPLTVRSSRAHHGRLLVSFENVDDRNAAGELHGTQLVADVSDVQPPDDPNEFWVHELEGLKVVTREGAELGTIVDVLPLPGGDTLAVRRSDGRELLIPFVAEFVPDVDITGGCVVVDPPPGLLELDES